METYVRSLTQEVYMSCGKVSAIFALLVVAVIAAAAIAYVALGRSSDPGATGSVRVTRGNIVRVATAVGRLEAEKEYQVNSTRGGILTKLFVKLGQRVEKNEPLAEVWPVVTEETVIQAERALRQAKLGEEAAREYVENSHLAGVLSKLFLGTRNLERMHEGSLLAQSHAEESLKLLREGEAVVDDRKIDFIVRSPAAGHVIEIGLREGSPVVPASTYGKGSVFVTIADMQRLVFRGTVDEIDVGKLREGMPARIRVGALPGANVDGIVREISLKASERNNAIVFDVLLDVKAPADLTIRSGYSAVAEIELDRREAALVLPERVVDFRGAKAYVQVPDGRGGRVEREIETGLSDGLAVEVVAGLDAGSEVLEKARTP
jgi:HlyD family secretion protein